MVTHNSDDIWTKLTDMEKEMVEIRTNQNWMRKNTAQTKSEDLITTKDLKDSIEKLHQSITSEISALSDRIGVVEKSSWYQRGFYAGIGAIISLSVILIPNLGKIL
jgi:hypothetical protein